MKVNLEVGNIADNLNNCEEIAVRHEVLEIILLPSWKGTSQKRDEKSKVVTSWRPNRKIWRKWTWNRSRYLKKTLIIQNQQIHKLSKIRQSKPRNNRRLRSRPCFCIDCKVVYFPYFKWTLLAFVSEIVLNFVFCSQETLS